MRTIEINKSVLRIDNIEAVGEVVDIETTNMFFFDILYCSKNHRGIIRVQLNSYGREKLFDTNVRLWCEFQSTIKNIRNNVIQSMNGRSSDHYQFSENLKKQIEEKTAVLNIFSTSGTTSSTLDFLM